MAQTNKRTNEKHKTHRLQLGVHHLLYLANVIYTQIPQKHITTLLIATHALLSSFSEISLQLANAHLARIERLRGLGLISTVLDRAELGVLLIQLTDANVLSGHPERKGTRNFSLDRINVIALDIIIVSKQQYDLLLLLRQFLLFAISRNLVLNQSEVFLIVVSQGFFNVAHNINAH